MNNIGLVAAQTVILNDPLTLVLGGIFTKEFTTPLGTFIETLTITSVQPSSSALGIQASGTIDDGAGGFDPTAVFYSAAYTQNGGVGAQINGSFNNSTIPPRNNPVPEPASLALLGSGLTFLGFLRHRLMRRKG